MRLFLQLSGEYWLRILIGVAIVNLTCVVISYTGAEYKVPFWRILARLLNVFAILVLGGAIVAACLN